MAWSSSFYHMLVLFCQMNVLRVAWHSGGTSKRPTASQPRLSSALLVFFVSLSDPSVASVMHPNESKIRCFSKLYMGSLGCCWVCVRVCVRRSLGKRRENWQQSNKAGCSSEVSEHGDANRWDALICLPRSWYADTDKEGWVSDVTTWHYIVTFHCLIVVAFLHMFLKNTTMLWKLLLCYKLNVSG